MTPLQPGDVVQYRKVGTARLVERTGPSGPDYEHYAVTGEGRWTVEWIRAPKKYRERLTTGFWIAANMRVAMSDTTPGGG